MPKDCPAIYSQARTSKSHEHQSGHGTTKTLLSNNDCLCDQEGVVSYE